MVLISWMVILWISAARTTLLATQKLKAIPASVLVMYFIFPPRLFFSICPAEALALACKRDLGAGTQYMFLLMQPSIVD